MTYHVWYYNSTIMYFKFLIYFCILKLMVKSYVKYPIRVLLWLSARPTDEEC